LQRWRRWSEEHGRGQDGKAAWRLTRVIEVGRRDPVKSRSLKGWMGIFVVEEEEHKIERGTSSMVAGVGKGQTKTWREDGPAGVHTIRVTTSRVGTGRRNRGWTRTGLTLIRGKWKIEIDLTGRSRS
jgi:hypothetical protein